MADYNYINQNNKNLKTFPKVSIRERKLKIRISVKKNQISELPEYFGQLLRLEFLNLSSNYFNHIPSVLSSLNKLIELNFGLNRIKNLEGIGNLSSLSILSLEGNEIEELPNELIKLEELTSINLSDNMFTSFPDKLLHLKYLKKLDLSRNKIYNLPKEIRILQNLTHLNISNIKLSRLPEEIKELKKLKVLHIDGNDIKLSKNYDPNKPKETIEWIIKRQEFAKLKTTKAFVFKNLNKKEINEKYDSVFADFTEEKGIEISYVNKLSDITKDVTVIFFIVGYDIHNKNELIFNLIDKCRKQDINYYILMEEDIIGGSTYVNFLKGPDFEAQHIALKKSFEIKYYNTYERLTNFIFNAVNQRAPNIKLNNIELKNIGHYENLNIPISENICCLVGENGTGKSTILKAIALCSIGHDFEGINKQAIQNLLRIDSLKDGERQYLDGSIKLRYTIDGDEFSNEIIIRKDDNYRDIKFIKNGAFDISTTGYNLKSLIIGFPQIRGGELKHTDFRNQSKLNEPHINDLLPLINGQDDGRLSSFVVWIEQLYFETLKKESETGHKKENIKEWMIIQKAFEVISSFSNHEITFKTVETGEPPIVWVDTLGAPNGVPLNLMSQGFKAVMGWVGYFIQRLIDSYPVQTPEQVTKSNAILIIDEVDSYLHPKWQSKIINILRENFPNTQFIISTHSPIAVSSCNEGEVVVLKLEENKVVANEIKNTKGWLVENILQDIMGLENTRDDEVVKKINEIEGLFLKKYKNEINSIESERLTELISEIDNLPPGDPTLTLINLKAFGDNII